jgi:hypothetical protein
MGRRTGRSSFEIAGLALLTMALLAFGGVAQLPLIEHMLHPHFAAACAEELLGDNPDPRIFAQNLGHRNSSSFRWISALSRARGTAECEKCTEIKGKVKPVARDA